MNRILSLLFLTLFCISAALAQTNVPDNVPTNGLIAYYPFNNNADDYSGNDNHGILQGNSNDPDPTTDRFGNANSAYEFGGYDHRKWIRVPNSTSLQLDSSFAASFWIFQYEGNSMDDYGHRMNRRHGSIISKDGDCGGLYIHTYDVTENSIRICFDNGSHRWYDNFDIRSEIGCFDSTKWMHYAVMIDGKHSSIYCNGVLVADSIQNQVANFNAANGKDLMIGIFFSSNPSWYPFYGKIDDIAIYNRALTADEVQSLYGGYVDQHEQCIYDTITAYGSIVWHGNTYTQSGDYVYRSTDGCDPVYHLHLNILGDCELHIENLPYTDNFDTYTTATTPRTYATPSCWTLAHQDVEMSDDYKPMIWYASENAHSGDYSLILNKRGIYAMPRFDGDVRMLQLSFFLKQRQTRYQLQVGVMTSLTDASSFEPVATLNNSTNYHLQTIDFSTYTGNGHYIAFRNILAPGNSGDFSCNYIDDITLSLNPSGCTFSSEDFPYEEYFDDYTTITTTKTGVQPPCWTLVHEDVPMTDEYKPMLWHRDIGSSSGDYSLILNKRCIYAMPRISTDIKNLILSFRLKQSQIKYQLQVGVMSDLNDISTFVPVKTINNSTTNIKLVGVNFSSYTGEGHYIAFRNILDPNYTGDFSCNYIDDINIVVSSNCGLYMADLPYTDNFDHYTTSTTDRTCVEPSCWKLVHQDVVMTNEYKPMIWYSSSNAHSGNYSLILNKRGIYAMPEYNGDVSKLKLSFYLKQPQTKYQLLVGVMSDINDISTFKSVRVINNQTTGIEHVEVDFSRYSGNGHFIAFRNFVADGNTSDFSCNYIDDLTLAVNCNGIKEADLPYTDNFDTYTHITSTAKTGVQPPCWTLAHQDVTMTDDYKPMIYYSADNAHSGNYSLILNKRGIYAMPAFEGDVNKLQLSFYLKQPQTYYQLQVGVMDNLNDESTFVPVETIINNSADIKHITIDFSSYTGNGHYIAFRNILNSLYVNVFSLNYIDDLTLSFNQSTCTLHSEDLPYTDNFDTYTNITSTAKTGVQPPCWTLVHEDVPMTDEYKPMIWYSSADAHSGNYSLILNKRGIYAMPYVDVDASQLRLQFNLKQPYIKHQLEVGVMTDLNDASTFVPVETLNNSSTTDYSHYTVDFGTYTGNGHYIAFRNILDRNQTGDFSCNFIDDLRLEVRPQHCGITVADLPFTENFDSYTTSTTNKTFAKPPCWRLALQAVIMTEDYKPMIWYSPDDAHSGNYSLILNKRGIFAMPAFEGNVNTLKLSMYLKQRSSNNYLMVGVMSNLNDSYSFDPVQIVFNDGRDYEHVEVDFSSYTGDGHYIAFWNRYRNGDDNTSDFSIFFIDDLTLTLNTSACTLNVENLPYYDNFDSYTTSTTDKTGVEPPCWTLAHQDVYMTDAYKPMIFYDPSRAASGNYSLILNKRGIYAMPYFNGNVRNLRLGMYLAQPLSKYQLQVGVMSDLNDVSTFVPVETVDNLTGGRTPITIDFSNYTGNGHYIAFRNILNPNYTGEFSCNYIDNLSLSIIYTVNTSVNTILGGSVEGSGVYTPGSTCTLIATPYHGYVFKYWTSGSSIVSTNPVYSFTVSSDRTLVANFCPADCDIEIGDLPYTDNFDNYTTSTTAKTHATPPCWSLVHQDVEMSDDYKPMIWYASSDAHSGNYSLILNKRGIYAMPYVNPSVNRLVLSFYLKQPQRKYQLQVGVLSDLCDASTFTPVRNIDNTTTNSEQVTVDFSNYTGSGHYIAFRNILAVGNTGDFSCNYIDDLTLELRPPKCIEISMASLPYTDNFDSYTTSTNTLTGVEPTCWTLAHQDVSMSAQDKPMIYYDASYAHSGNYSLILNKRGIYAMPEFDGDVSQLQLSFYLRQLGNAAALEVGVMSDLTDASTFEPVATSFVHTEGSIVEVSFESYNGTGHYIAFRNTLAPNYNGDYSRNIIDNITLSPNCSINSEDFPYTNNFDWYTTSTSSHTYVRPNCWTLANQDVEMTDYYKPMIYYDESCAHSGRYSLILNKRGILTMPRVDARVSTLQMELYVRQTQAKYQLQVGVMSSPSNVSSFVPVVTINNNSTYTSEYHLIDFSSYTGNGQYIAFRNILAPGYTGDYSCNYIDDITLSFADGCALYPADLPYTNNFDTYTSSTTTKTGVQPDCWTLVHEDVPMTTDYRPMIYYSASCAHNGNYSLILNKRCIYSMPAVIADVNTLQMAFYVRQTQSKYQLQVGVLTSPDDYTTFVPVATIDNGSNTSTSVLHTVNFSSYSGNGQYIAFRNILASGQTGDYSCNYIDNITLSLTSAAMSKGNASNNTFATNKHLTLYPNPTTGILTVEADEEVVRVDVFDYTGRCVASFERQTTVDLGRLATGLYTLRVTLPERIEVRRVVKQ